MYLSKTEERILNGEFGEAKSLAMKILVKVGEALGAQELIPISHAHISGVSYFNIGDAGLELIEDIITKGGKADTFTSANPYATVYADFLGSRYSDKVVAMQLRIINALKQLGVQFFTCVPYNVRPPKYGEHLAWAESNAVLYSNSVLGALSNKEGGLLALLASLVGRTYKAGVHIFSNRRPSIHVKVCYINNYVDLGLAGLIIGELIGNNIPYITGLRVGNPYELKIFLAALGTTSNTPMAVIHGVTPEYRELTKGISFSETFNVDYDLINEWRRRVQNEVINGRGLYLIGCPHLSFKELGYVLRSVYDAVTSLNAEISDRELWITTYGGFINNSLSELINKLVRYNVKVIPNACAVVSHVGKLGVNYVVTDSVKALNYISKLSGVQVILAPLNELLNLFVRGRFK